MTRYSRPLTEAEETAIVRHAIGSLRLADIDVTEEEAWRIWERVRNEPVVNLFEEETFMPVPPVARRQVTFNFFGADPDFTDGVPAAEWVERNWSTHGPESDD